MKKGVDAVSNRDRAQLGNGFGKTLGVPQCLVPGATPQLDRRFQADLGMPRYNGTNCLAILMQGKGTELHVIVWNRTDSFRRIIFDTRSL